MYRFFLFFLVFTRLEAASDNSLMLDEQIATGFAYFNEGKWKAAKQLFQALQSHDNPHIQNFGNLGLAKVAIHENRFEDAKNLLKKTNIEDLIPLELRQEWILAESDLALNQGQYEACFACLKKADPKSPKTLLSTAKAYMSQAESTPHLQDRLKALNQAETCLNELKCTHNKTVDSLETALQISKCEGLIQENSISGTELASYILKQIPETHVEKALLQSQILAKKGQFPEAIYLLEQLQIPPSLHEKQQFLIGTFLYEEKKYPEALSIFQDLKQKYPESSLAPETLYWIARGKEAKGEPVAEYRPDYQNLYQNFPNHPLAEEAYFNCYSPQDYLLGDKPAIKHLNAFQGKFPRSPLLLHASYYIGLDCLHDRRSFEGKWISRQNLIGAIEAFQNVETLFNKLQITQEVSHLIPIRDQAILERAKTNLKVAALSKSAKKAIYLDYAEEVFSDLQSTLNDESGPIYQETLYFLALTQIQSDKSRHALQTLETLIQSYKDKKIENAYYLASALYQKGLLENGPVELFDQALQAGKPTYLSNDDILNIMIAKAEVYRKEGKLDAAMLQLSEVVNYSTASSLRLKAMFLRAEIYIEQGRKPLAQKQLESIALKGGDWAIKAKEQLDKYHGYE